MPVYVFGCDECGHQQEETMRISDDRSNVKCGKCGAKTVQRPTPISFQLKGTGWYVTDYANKGKDG